MLLKSFWLNKYTTYISKKGYVWCMHLEDGIYDTCPCIRYWIKHNFVASSCSSVLHFFFSCLFQVFAPQYHIQILVKSRYFTTYLSEFTNLSVWGSSASTEKILNEEDFFEGNTVILLLFRMTFTIAFYINLRKVICISHVNFESDLSVHWQNNSFKTLIV